MKLTYGVDAKPKAGQLILFALQQLLAILAATIAVPAIVGHGMSQSAALFGAGIGTLIYQLLTKFKSPVFLGSSFAFLPSMFAAFAGAATAAAGFAGILIGAGFAGLVYVLIAIAVKCIGVKWIDKLMPPVVIGPTVALIGLSLAHNAVGDALKLAQYDGANSVYVMNEGGWVCLICAFITLAVVMISSVYGKKMAKMVPFIIGIAAGYAAAAIFTIVGKLSGIDAFKIINFDLFINMKWLPDFTFLTAIDGFAAIDGKYIATIAVAYVPVAFVVFAEHLADHKNISSIIESDLLKDPGLHRTLLGDGLGSIAGAIFGGCPNTTYGESIGCVAISGNASVVTITATAVLAIVASFIAPFTTFLATIPSCVMGGVCISLYGFIAVSGLKMVQKVDLNDNRNLFTVAAILICGIGGMALKIVDVTLTAIACALIVGIFTNLLLSRKEGGNVHEEPAEQPEEPKENK